MLNPIDEMRRLSNKSYEELMRLAITNFGFCPNSKNCSKVEIITYIVAFSVLRDRFADEIAHPEKHKEEERTRVALYTEDNETYHLMLTREQMNFMDWCFENRIDFSGAGAQLVEEVEWEMP